MSHVFYSFLALDSNPDPDHPHVAGWDGKAIYDTMTAADVLEVMQQRTYNWQRVKIEAMMQACKANGTKFIWAVGGWSDLT